MASGRVLHGSREGVHVLRFVGELRYPIAPSVTQFVARLFAAGELEGIVIDLSEATSIDSTNLGMIARIATRMNEHNGKRVTLVSERHDINEVLTSMGFREVFDIVEDADVGRQAAAATVETRTPSPTELGRIMLEAHRALMELNEKNRDEFRDVVSLLERDVAGG